jgi:hypothetical protein
MARFQIELDRKFLLANILGGLIIFAILAGWIILVDHNSLPFPILWYIGAIAFFAAIGAILLEAVTEWIGGWGFLIFVLSALVIVSLPLPGEFNFLVATVLTAAWANGLIWFMENF